MATERFFQPPMAFDVSPVDHDWHPPRPALGLVAGLVAGLAGTWVMTRFAGRPATKEAADSFASPSLDGDDPQNTAGADPLSDFTSDVARVVLGRELPDEAQPLASTTVRYLYGALAGALYGAVAESDPEVTHGLGAWFGTSAWGFAGALARPEQARLATVPYEDEAPPSPSAMLPGAIYGITTELVRRGLRGIPLGAR